MMSGKPFSKSFSMNGEIPISDDDVYGIVTRLTADQAAGMQNMYRLVETETAAEPKPKQHWLCFFVNRLQSAFRAFVREWQDYE